MLPSELNRSDTLTGIAYFENFHLIRIEVVSFFPDAESSPVGTPFPGTAAGAILFGTGIRGQALNCVDARTGELIWKTPVPYPAFGAPTVAGDFVLTGVGNGNFIRSDPNPAGAILCLALRDGKKTWEVPVGDTILGAIAVRDDRAYACSRDGKVTVVETSTGRVAHQFSTGTPMVCSPAVTADSVYVTTEAGKLFCLDRRGARVRWSLPLAPGQPIISSPAVAGGNVYVGTRSKGLICLGPPDLEAGPPPIRPWTGPGGNAGRTGAADDSGPPALAEELSKARWKIKNVRGPIIACGEWIYAAIPGTLSRPFELSSREAAK